MLSDVSTPDHHEIGGFKVDDRVAYFPGHGAQAEMGIVTRVKDAYVFVRYGDERGSKATKPADLRRLR